MISITKLLSLPQCPTGTFNLASSTFKLQHLILGSFPLMVLKTYSSFHLFCSVCLNPLRGVVCQVVWQLSLSTYNLKWDWQCHYSLFKQTVSFLRCSSLPAWDMHSTHCCWPHLWMTTASSPVTCLSMILWRTTLPPQARVSALQCVSVFSQVACCDSPWYP